MHHSRRLNLLLILVLLLHGGCTEFDNPTTMVPTIKTPEELVGVVEECVELAGTTHEMLQVNFEGFRVRVLRKRVDQGLAAIHELLAHPDVSPEQVEAARCAESELLLYGATHCKPNFVDDLNQLAKELMTDSANSEPCRLAIARWLWIKFADPSDSLEEAEKVIVKFARTYPDTNEAAMLLSRLSEQLVNRDEFKDAGRVLTVGDSILKDGDALNLAKSQLANRYREAQGQLARKAAQQAFRASIKAKLGGREKGYFVVFSVEQSERRLCDYSVCDGLDSVVTYVKQANDKKWRWELIESFPDTAEGCKKAGNKRTMLLRNTSVVWVTD